MPYCDVSLEEVSMMTLGNKSNCWTSCLLALVVFGVGIGCGDESTNSANQLDAEVLAFDSSVSADQTTAEDGGTTEGADSDVNQEADAAANESVDASSILNDAAVTAVNDMDVSGNDVTVGEGDMTLIGLDVAMQPDMASMDAATSPDQPDSAVSLTKLGCRVGDVWVLTISSIALAGQGCQTGGGSGQSDDIHRLQVIQENEGQIGLTMLEPSTLMANFVATSLTLSEDGDRCRFTAHAEVGINFPNDVSQMGRTTQVHLRYDYQIYAEGNAVAGTGLVTTSYYVFPDASNLDQSTVIPLRDACSEPLEVIGTVLTP